MRCVLSYYFFVFFCEINKCKFVFFPALFSELFRWFRRAARCISQVARSTRRVHVCRSFVVAGDQRQSSNSMTLSLYVCDL